MQLNTQFHSIWLQYWTFTGEGKLIFSVPSSNKLVDGWKKEKKNVHIFVLFRQTRFSQASRNLSRKLIYTRKKPDTFAENIMN